MKGLFDAEFPVPEPISHFEANDWFLYTEKSA